MNYRVCVITVTYGARWTLLRRSLSALVNHDDRICHIVVVDNGSEYSVADAVTELNSDRIVVERLAQNLGSAKGFSVGIATAMRQTSSDFLWFMDDDNSPTDGALGRLLLAYELLGGNSKNTLLSLRPGNYADFVGAARTGTYAAGNAENAFLSFHVRDTIAKIRKRMGWTSSPDKVDRNWPFPLVAVGYAPWGGFLIHRSWIEKIGLPKEEFFLYSEDTEFSGRIRLNGGTIYLCANSVVEDLETQWSSSDIRGYPLLSCDTDPTRVYYATRNKVYLQLSRSVTNRAVYYFNMSFYLTVTFVYNILAERNPLETIRRLSLVLRAINDGRAGRLGIMSTPHVGAKA